MLEKSAPPRRSRTKRTEPKAARSPGSEAEAEAEAQAAAAAEAEAEAAAEAAEEAEAGKVKSSASRMVAWRGLEGSRYAAHLFKSHRMPGGKGKVYFHHEQTRC
jgi:hypothetical protein